MAERTHERSPWRIAHGEVVALMHAVLARGGSAETVSLKMNAKGGTQPELTVVVQKDETLAQAVERAQTAYDGLVTRYARPDTPFGPGRTEGESEARNGSGDA